MFFPKVLRTKFSTIGFFTLVAVICCYLWLTLSQGNSAYVIDEAAFPFAANGVLSHGFPVFYNGETRPQDIGLWHPPLYIYTLAGHIALFGFSPLSVRLYGIFAVLVSLVVLYIALKVLSPRSTQISVLVLAAVFLLNPLVISGALVPDIDGSLGIFSFSLIALVSVMFLRSDITYKLWIFASIVMLILFSTKFTIALLGIMVLGIAAMLSEENKLKKIIAAVSSTVIGFSLFLVLYSLLSIIPGFVYSGPFDYFFGSLSQRKTVTSDIPLLIWDRLFSGPGSVIYWLTPGLFLALIASSIYLWRSKDMKQKRATVLLTSAICIVLFSYAVITSSPFGFPKYWGIAVVPSALLVALSFNRINFLKINRTPAFWVAITSALVLVTVSIIIAYKEISQTTSEVGRSIPLVLIYTFVLAMLFFLTLLASINLRQKSSATTPIGALIVGALTLSSIALGTVIDFVNARAQYSTRYYFSEVGMNQVVDFLREEIPAQDVILVAKDAGIQSNHLFVEDAQWLFLPPQELEKALLNSKVRYWVTRNKWDYSEPSFPEQFELLKKYFVPLPIQPSPDFVVWKRI